MEYQSLGDEQKRAMLNQRIHALEVDHYGHQMNLAGLQTLPDNDPGKVKVIEKVESDMAIIEAAHVVAVAELSALPVPPSQESEGS